MEQRIQAFPSIRLFKQKNPQIPDYRGDRTVEALMEYLRTKLSLDHSISQLDADAQKAHNEAHEAEHETHPGCLLAGYLLVNRVPGNFHIEARSEYHNLNPIMANLSHTVNNLSFGNNLNRGQQKILNSIPEYFSKDSMAPLNNREFVVKKIHSAWHHHMKVVSTHIGKGFGGQDLLAYQIVVSSQVMRYGNEEVPEARFSYDLSPMAVVIEKTGKRWYEFATSIAALIGGTFTVVGLLSSFLGIMFKAGKRA